jgi:hypothetical protein
MCSTCGQKVLMDGFCCRHLKQKCLICLEPVGSTNTITSKRLSCGHAYHPGCIIEWFITSDECPSCRCKQPEDPLIVFKEKVENQLRAKYKDAIDSLETEVQRLTDTLRMQSLFMTAGIGVELDLPGYTPAGAQPIFINGPHVINEGPDPPY